MSEPATGAPAPANPDPQPAPAPAPAPTPQAEPPQEPDWLPKRLDRAKETGRAELLTALGVSDLAEAQKAIEEARARAEASKTLEQRLADLEAAAKAKDEQLNAYSSALSERAEYEMASLTDEQRSAVVAIAGDDASKRLNVIANLRPTWAASAAATPPPATNDPQPAPAQSGTTAPDAPAPSPGTTPAPTDHRAIYEAMKKSPRDGLRAAAYLARYGAEIYPDK